MHPKRPKIGKKTHGSRFESDKGSNLASKYLRWQFIVKKVLKNSK